MAAIKAALAMEVAMWEAVRMEVVVVRKEGERVEVATVVEVGYWAARGDQANRGGLKGAEATVREQLAAGVLAEALMVAEEMGAGVLVAGAMVAEEK